MSANVALVSGGSSLACHLNDKRGNELFPQRRLEMKKQAYTMIAMMVLFGCLAISARAQCLSRTQSSAKIPFQFSAEQKSLPAGEYTVECLIPEQGMLTIRSADRKVDVILSMIPAAADAERRGRLVFHRYGSQHFLAHAWIGGSLN